VLRVTYDENASLHSFLHGTTIHGRESLTPERRCEPLSYHHRGGPLGSIFANYQARPANQNIAVIGLGAGAAIAYSKPNETWTFYEINPAVLSIASDKRYFGYMSECAKATISVVLGDARLKLQEAAPESYGLILIDAFSSDAIPVHLITQEALDLYMSKLAPKGLLVLHISNRNLDLSGVVADLARSRRLTCLGLFDRRPSEGDRDPSKWVVISRNSEDSVGLMQESFAEVLNGKSDAHVWTDDFSNILSVLKWR
jgi:hypothetical protein